MIKNDINKLSKPERDRMFLKYCYEIASSYSDDSSTQIGAIIIDQDYNILSTGYNSLCNGVKKTDERINRPLKYSYMEHAERNAIYGLARLSYGLRKTSIQSSGILSDRLTMYCPYFACVDCGRAIIQSGIKHVIGHKEPCDNAPDRWKESINMSLEMFKESGVTYEYYDGKIDDSNQICIMMNDKKYYP